MFLPFQRTRRSRPRPSVSQFAEALEHRVLLTVNNPSVAEGGPGTTVDMVFTLTFRGVLGEPTIVDYQTLDGTATEADGDYTPAFGSEVFFGSVPQNKQVRVPVIGDAKREPDETFFLDLTNEDTGESLGQAIGTIVNDDAGSPPVVISLTDSPDPVSQDGTLTLTAAVSDPDGDAISRVDFFREADGVAGISAGDVLVATSGTAPFSVSAAVASLPLGTYTYYARATDRFGMLGAAASTTNTVANAAPHIDSFTANPNPIFPEQTLTLTAAVSDVEGDATTVFFYRETNGRAGLQTQAVGTLEADTLLSSGTAAPFTWSGSVADLPAGLYTYYALAADATGATVASFRSTLSRPAPVVASLAASPEPVDAGSNVTLTASGVNDPRRLPVAVEFYRESNGLAALQPVAGGDVFLGSVGTPASGNTQTGFTYRFTFPTTGMPFGAYTYYARPVNQVGTTGNVVSTTGTVVHPPPVVGALHASPDPVAVRGTLTLTANGVTDPEGPDDVASVSFYRESNNVAGLQTGAGGDLLLGADGIGADGYSVAFQLTSGMPQGVNTWYAQAIDRAGGQSNVVSTTSTVGLPPAVVVARHLFYNDSAFDGGDPAAGAADDAAIAPDKAALLPGQTATFANVTSFSRGINGVMIDIAGLWPDFTVTPQLFDVNGTADPASTGNWPALPAPAVNVRRGAGVNGSDRVTLTWPDGAVRNTWLRVGVRYGGGSGLQSPDIFYFASLPGDAGPAVPARVDGADVLAVRAAHAKGPAPIDSRFDFNRDGVVNVVDERIARANEGRALPTFQATTAAPAAAAAPLRAPRQRRGSFAASILA